MKTPILALAATATLLTGAPALAGKSNEDAMVVHYADLDLNTTAGQKTLETRIDAAAKKYCTVGAYNTGTRITSSKAKKCYREAKRLASRQFAKVMDETRLGG